MKRLPRKLKKELKKKFLNRYGHEWLNCYNKSRLIIEYYWFYQNPFYWDVDKQLTITRLNKKNDRNQT